MPGQTLPLSLEEVHHLYLDEKMSPADIAEHFKVSEWTVWSCLKSLGVPLRNHSEALSNAHRRYQNNWRKLVITPEELRELYLRQGKSALAIASQFGVTHTTVKARLLEFDIPIRSLKQAAAQGENHPHWKGGRYESGGYAYIKSPNHPRANRAGYIPQHVSVWEYTHNQRLPEGYLVHHLNDIKSDSRPSNLFAMPKRKHHARLFTQALQARLREVEMEVDILRRALKSEVTIPFQ